MRPGPVCHSCGRDLSGLRACREPHYGWWIVTCPTCGRVRPVRPRAERARPIRRVAALVGTFVLLAAQASFLFVFGIVTLAASLIVAEGLLRRGAADHVSLGMAVGASIAAAFVVGVWASGPYETGNGRRVQTLWLAWMALLLVASQIFGDLTGGGREGSRATPVGMALAWNIALALPLHVGATIGCRLHDGGRPRRRRHFATRRRQIRDRLTEARNLR